MYLKCISKVSIDTVKNVYIYTCVYTFFKMYMYTYIYTPKVSRYVYLDTLQHCGQLSEKYNSYWNK